jgi:triosephosphate isomerase
MQTKAALYGIAPEELVNVVIAYEPVWAIGTGKTATPKDAQDVCSGIRAVVRSLYGDPAARAIPILYGGSMNEKNAFDLLVQPDIDGGLIGGASLKPALFAEVIKAANQ